MPEIVITRLHTLLDQERAALMAADFDSLATFVSDKENLLSQLGKARPTKDVLRPIRQKMDENLALLAAAIKGVAAAGERLASLQTVKSGLSVYDGSGRLAHVRTQHPTLEKKA